MNENWFEKIEEYLSGSMSPEERVLFEEEVAINKDLSELLNLYRGIEIEMRSDQKYKEQELLLNSSLKSLGTIYFKKEEKHDLRRDGLGIIRSIDNVDAGTDKNSKTITINQGVWLRLLVAAGLGGIVILGIIGYQKNKNHDLPDETVFVNNNKTKDTSEVKSLVRSDTLAASPAKKSATVDNTVAKNNDNLYQKKIPKVIQDSAVAITVEPPKEKSRSPEFYDAIVAANYTPDKVPETQPDNLQVAFDYYKTQEYKASLESFENGITRGPSRGQSTEVQLTQFYCHYYIGLIYLSNGNGLRATAELKTAIEIAVDKSWQGKAQWYLALAYLKTGEYQKAKDLLEKVAANGNLNGLNQKAMKILDEIKNAN